MSDGLIDYVMVKKNRRGNQEIDKQSPLRRNSLLKLGKGEMVHRSNHSTDIGKWKDKKEAWIIGNKLNVKMLDVTKKRGVPKQKPNHARDYNLAMPSVDRSELMSS